MKRTGAETNKAIPGTFYALYRAIVTGALLNIFLIASIDVIGHNFYLEHFNTGFLVHPTLLLAFLSMMFLELSRREVGFGPLLELMVSRLSLVVTSILVLFVLLRFGQGIGLSDVAWLNAYLGVPGVPPYLSLSTLLFATIVHVLGTYVSTASKRVWVAASYVIFVVLFIGLTHQLVDGALRSGTHGVFPGMTVLGASFLLFFSALIFPNTRASGLLFDARAPKSNGLGVIGLSVALLIEGWTAYCELNNALSILGSFALMLGLPILVGYFRPREIRARIAKGELTEEGLSTKFIPKQRELEALVLPDGFFERWVSYATFVAPEWQRYVIQAFWTFALAYGAILFGRSAENSIAMIWWANGYLAYCFVLHPKQDWPKVVIVFYVSVLCANVIGGNSIIASSIFTLVNVLEGGFIAAVLIAIMGIQLHGRRVVASTFSVLRSVGAVLTIIFISAFSGLVGGAAVTLLFGGNAWENATLWSFGSMMGAITILAFSTGKVLELHWGFRRLRPHVPYVGLFAAIYLLAFFSLYAFLPIPKSVSSQHILFIILTLPLAILPSLFQASGLMFLTTNIYYYFGTGHWSTDGTAYQFPFVITVSTTIVTLVFIGRHIIAKAQDAETRALRFAPNALITLDEEGSILTISKNSNAWFDMAYHALVGKNLMFLLGVDEARQRELALLFSANPEDQQKSTIERALPTGERHYLEVVIVGNQDLSLPYAYVVSLTDVTDLEMSRSALVEKNLEAEARLQFLENSPAATLLQDRNFIVRNVSAGWTRLTGFSREETLGKDLSFFLAEGEQEQAFDSRSARPQIREDDATHSWGLRTKSGKALNVTIMSNAVEGVSGQEVTFVSSVTDITELATQKALADTLLNSTAAIIVSQSRDWKIQTCSDAWVKQFGYSREETVGHDLIEFMEPEDAEKSKAFREVFKSDEASETIIRNTVRLRTKSGALRYVDLQSVSDASAEAWRHFVSMTDVTPLMMAKEQALAGEKAKTDFLATMSHEIRTPLNGLLGHLSLLTDTPLSAQQERYVKNMETSGKLLMNHISDVLDITKYDENKLTARPIAMNLNILLQDIIDNQSGAALANDTALGWAWVGPPIDWIINDRELIQNVLMNVIGNAVKFTHAGEVKVTLEAVGSGAALEIEIRDNGIGMDKVMQARIFGVFTTRDSSYTRGFGGTGLGLALVWRFVKALGGRISVESAPGAGSVFCIRLPITRIDEPNRMRRGDAQAQDGNSQRVLLVEDNEINRVVAGEMLRAAGHAVTEAHNGREAVTIAQDQAFDLIFMDISMPVLDGVSATREIRAGNGLCSDVPIVALTASIMPEEQEAFLAAGMTDILTKPLSRATLIRTVSTLGAK
jgi:PAS domain S-box-containing protein